MPAPDADDRLTALAEALADGETPDWDSASAEASDDDERDAIRHLRAIAEATRFNAELAVHASMSVRSLLAHGRPSDGPGALDAPIVWGSLRIHEKIGRGRFGDVYRAWDPSLERDVALKLLRDDDGAPDRPVVDEGRLMARVRHPNVATIYGAQRIDGRTGLWMELIEGQTLEAELAARGPFGAADLVRTGIELCRALTAVHRAGLVHRDVKAQNVLQETGGRIVLGDFGTGHELQETASSTALAGTPAYLAPEVFQHAPAGPQRDVYSLGTLLFHLATGSYPIHGRTIGEIREAHAKGTRTRLRELRPDLPEPLLSVVDTALEPDPARRYQDAASMEAALAQVQPEGKLSRRAASLWLMVGAGAAIAATWAGVVWTGRAGGGNASRGAALSAGLGESRTLRQISPDSALAGPGGPSPDGRLLSFVDDAGDLAIHEIATGKRWAVTGNRAAGKPSGYAETSRFTADGSQLLYVWYPQPEQELPIDAARPTEIRAVSIRGGESRRLWSGEGNAELVLRHWAGDDSLIVVNEWKAEQRSQLVVVDLDTSTTRAVHPIGRTSPNGASLSPDATHLVYDKPDPATRLRDIYIAGVGGAGEAPLVRDASSDHTPMWTKDGRYVLFLSDRSGPTSLWAQRVEAARAVGRPVRVEPNLGWAFPMGETADGAYFFRRQMGTRDVYVVDVDASSVITSEPVRASSEVVGANGASDWSPDGRQLAFFRRRDDRWSLVVKAVDEGREREIADPNVVGIGRPRWESSGTSILFKAAYRERSGLHRLDLRTGAIATVIPHFIGHYDLIPRSTALIYETDRRRFVRHDLAVGTSTPIHDVEPPWTAFGMAISPDGDRLAYTATQGQKAVALRLVDLAKPESFREVYRCPADESMDAHAFTRDGREVIVKRAKRRASAREGDGSSIWAVDVETGAARLLGLKVHGINQVRLSPDGRRLSFDGGWPAQEVWVLEHFLSSLEGH